MKTAYSYKRWSSGKQSSGDSLKRQAETAIRVCAEKGWQLIDLPIDAGVSAFKGKNIAKGALGAFLDKVKKGDIETPCVLIVEKIDRFSREAGDDILEPFRALLKSGVEVYSVIENEHYTKEKLKSDFLLSTIKMCMAFEAANNYSKTLSERIGTSVRRMIAKAANGEQVNLGSYAPSYFSWNGKAYVENEKANTIRTIFNEYEKGTGVLAICRLLNDSNTPTLKYGKKWFPQLIYDLLSSRFCIGEYKGKPYFPAVISPVQFNRVQANLERNTVRGGKRSTNRINILKGLVYCVECGKAVPMSSSSKTNVYYRCVGKYTHTCYQSSMIRVEWIEQNLFGMVLGLDPSSQTTADNSDNMTAINALKAKRIETKKQFDLKTKLLDEHNLTGLIPQLKELQATLDKVEGDLKQAESKLSIERGSPEALAKVKEMFGDINNANNFDGLNAYHKYLAEQLKDQGLRARLKNEMYKLVSRIELDFDLGPQMKVTLPSGRVFSQEL